MAGGLLPIATGGDGGGSIRIPAGFTGMFGLKSTFGRIPKGPHTEIEPLTAVLGCISRSVRDSARWYDVCNGADEYDPFSLPRVEGWEAGLGTFDLRASGWWCRATSGRPLSPRRWPSGGGGGGGPHRRRRACAGRRAGRDPRGGLEWAMAGTASLLVGLEDRYPACEQNHGRNHVRLQRGHPAL